MYANTCPNQRDEQLPTRWDFLQLQSFDLNKWKKSFLKHKYVGFFLKGGVQGEGVTGEL